MPYKDREKELKHRKEYYQKAGKKKAQAQTEEQKQKKREYNREYVKKYPEKLKETKFAAHIKHMYGLNPEDVEKMFIEQDGKCDICKKEITLVRKQSNYRHIDHNHLYDRYNRSCPKEAVRGLLCSHCNHLIGDAFDNTETLRNAIDYLEKFKNKN